MHDEHPINIKGAGTTEDPWWTIPVQVYEATTGKHLTLAAVYVANGILCVDVEIA
jgi:hypothetical protein